MTRATKSPSLETVFALEGDVLRLSLSGDLDRTTASNLLSRTRTMLRKTRTTKLVIDASGLLHADSAGIAALAHLVESNPGSSVLGIPHDIASLAAALPAPQPAPAGKPETFFFRMGEFAQQMGKSTSSILEFLGDVFAGALSGLFSSKDRRKGSLQTALLELGADAIPVVLVIAAILGLILAFQAAYQLRSFGASIYVANLVALSAVRELSPLLVAVVVAGRSGSAIAAEIGTMKVGEELDALQVMGIQPIRFLVVPRLLAVTVTQPLLTGLGALVSIAAGALISLAYLGLSLEPYLRQTLRALDTADLLHGLGKSVLFGWTIVLIGSYNGLNIERSAEAVGKAATKTVVAIIFALIVTDGLITTLNTVL